jgi:small-conductance mechanosensitive channel
MTLDARLARFAAPAAILAACTLAGIVVERLVLAKLAKLARRTSTRMDDVFVAAVRGLPIAWGIVAGLSLAATSLELSRRAAAAVAHGVEIATIVTLAILVARLLSGAVEAYAERAGRVSSTSIIRNVTSLSVAIVALLLVLESLGIAIAPILTALGVGGLAVALALKDTLSNLFSGIQILVARQVRVGDYVRLDSGDEGYVEDIQWRNTTIRALPNNAIIVPNSKLAEAIVTNYHRPDRELAVLVDCGVAYDSDLDKVERVTVDVARDVLTTVRGGVPGFEPFIRYNAFGPSSINFTVILRGAEFSDKFLVTHEFIKRLQRRYAAEGIEIPFPVRTVLLRGQSAAPSPL